MIDIETKLNKVFQKMFDLTDTQLVFINSFKNRKIDNSRNNGLTFANKITQEQIERKCE